jgi:hypothetical protein
MKKLLLSLFMVSALFVSKAQTALISAADGGFETGATFAANGWTVVNDATNTWNLGTVPGWFTGTRGAYISQNAGTAWTYATGGVQRSHFYRDIAFPAAQPVIKLEFDIRADGNDGLWDNLMVYVANTAITPSNAGPTGQNTTTTGWTGYTDGTTGYYLTQYNSTSVPATTTHISYTLTAAQAAFVQGNTKRLIFTWRNDGSGGTQPPASVDNIQLTSSCSGPVLAATTAITQTGATLNFAAIAGAAGYNVQYRVAGTTTWINAAGNPYATNTAVITGLVPSTNYEFQVAATGAVCNANSVTGTFATLCGTAPLPWTEGFEGVATTGANIFPNCWTKELVTGTNSPGTYNTNDTYREPHSGSNLLYTQYNTAAWVYTPGFALTAGTSYRFSFWMKNKVVTSPVDFVMDVKYGTAQAAASMTNALQAAYTASNGGWVKFSYDFTPATTGTFYMGIKSTSASFTPWYLSFDDFKMDVTPTCTEPINIVSSAVVYNGATISWAPGAIGTAANGYDYYVSTTNTAPVAATIPTGSVAAGVTTKVLTGLNASTAYYVWVRSKCSATDISDWSSQITFTTPCQPLLTLSWTEGFEGVAAPGANVFPSCWARELVTGTNSPGTYGTNDTYREPHAGTKLLYTQYSTAAWVYTPPFNVSAGVAYTFSFWMKNKVVTSPVDFVMDVKYGNAQTAAAMTNTLQTAYNANNSAWTQFTYNVTPTTSGTIFFGIKSTSATLTPWYLSFDDFAFTQVTPCPLATTAISYASASYCTTTATAAPVITGSTGGTFTSTTGLVIDPATGVISPAASTPGNYVVTYTVTGLGACGNVVKTANIAINTISVAPTGATASNPSICGNSGTTNLSVVGGTLGTGASFKWYTGSCGGTPVGTGATLSNVFVNQTTTFYVRAEGPCNSTVCASVTVNVNPVPQVILTAANGSVNPVATNPSAVTSISTTVSPVGSYNYAWTLNGAPLSLPANTSSITPANGLFNGFGTYQVTVTNIVSGCTATSNTIAVSDIAAQRDKLFIYPNPSNGVVYVSYYSSTPAAQARIINLYDGKGARLSSQAYTTTGAYGQMKLDLSGLVSGVYMVELTDASNKRLKIEQIIKN